MFERFTDKGRKVIILAREEAERYQHTYLGVEHILLGIFRSRGGMDLHFGGQKVSLSKIREEFEHYFTSNQKITNSPWFGEIPFTPDAKAAIENAVKEARRLGSKVIEPRHLLLGVLCLEDSMSAKILKKFGIELGKARVLFKDSLDRIIEYRLGLLSDQGKVVEEFVIKEDDPAYVISDKLMEAVARMEAKESLTD